MLFVFDWCCKVNYWSCYFFWWFIGRQVICTNVQDEMIPTAPYRWFYIIVHSCWFCTWKGFNKHLTICVQFFGHFHPLRYFTILSPMTNIDFSFFFPFGLSFLWSPAKIVFCGLQLLSKDLTIAMFWLIFLDVSSSCLSFWLSFSLLQKHPEFVYPKCHFIFLLNWKLKFEILISEFCFYPKFER